MMIALFACLLTSVAPAGGAAAGTGAHVDVSAQALVLLQSDHATKGGGAGAALALALGDLSTAFLLDGSGFEGRARAGVLGGAGLAWNAEVGAAWRVRLFDRYEPDIG